MDYKTIGSSVMDTDTYFVYVDDWSSQVEFYRIVSTQNSNGNGALYFRGGAAAEGPMGIKIWDCQIGEFAYGHDGGPRMVKNEAHGMNLENVWGADIEYSGILCGDWDQPSGSYKYMHITTDRSTGNMAEALQLRSRNTEIEWLYSEGFISSIGLQGYDYRGDDTPHPWNISVKNAYLTGAGDYGIRMGRVPDPVGDDFDTIHFENVFIEGPGDTGFEFQINGEATGIDNVTVLNCLVVDAGEYGMYINSAHVDRLTVDNSIIVGSGTSDIHLDGTGTNKILRNTIYTSKSGTTWDTETALYDTDTADPFEDAAGGDYTTADGITAVIDQGTDISQDEDMLGNEIGTQDISCFEKDGSEYNWTNR
jgi:hypothetical protein